MTLDSFADYRKLGDHFRDTGMCQQAVDAYRAAARINPNDAETRFYLGLMLRDTFNLPAALVEFQQVVRLAPRSPEGFSNLGLVWNELGQPAEAAKACRMAIQLQKDFAAAWCNLGLALQSLGQIDEAIDSLRTAVQLNPTESAWHSNLLYALNFRPQIDAAALFAEHRAWAARYTEELTAAAVPPQVDLAPDRRLRIGYVSAHFRHHAVNFFVEPILASHDHQRFEVICYADAPPSQSDAVTQRLRAHADQWRPIFGTSHEQVAEMVRRDQVDILVDLSAHMGSNRLLAFARRPAPVQVTYIGYQNTTGMTAMDYRLTDEWSDPSGVTDQYYTEKLVRLPECFFCYRPLSEAPSVDPLPADRSGAITFGSFNNFAKVNAGVLAAWSRILTAVPSSRLIVLAAAPDAVGGQVRSALARHDVAVTRVEMVPMRTSEAYLRLIQQANIALDTFPFNGHTTTCDALWMGVPVVSLAGDRYASRYGSSALVNLGLRDLVAESVDGYVEIAVKLAGDRERLRALRASLRTKMAESCLLDAAGFTRKLEVAYRAMWAAAAVQQRTVSP